MQTLGSSHALFPEILTYCLPSWKDLPTMFTTSPSGWRGHHDEIHMLQHLTISDLLAGMCPCVFFLEGN